jgi:2,3-bisphosphoglycerate-independent phosphoglycerate mutase
LLKVIPWQNDGAGRLKFILVVGDGMADEPLEALNGRTPLEVSRTPNMDFYARNGTVGRVRTIPEGMPPGSDVANMSLMGYSPRTYYTGRAPLEAASMGLELGPDDIVFRCNLVTLEERREGLFMADYSGGGISTGRAGTFIQALNEELADPRFQFYPGVSYRHVLLWRDGRKEFEGIATTPPHDILGQAVDGHLPSGPGSRGLREMMDRARGVISARASSIPQEGPSDDANAIWLWGEGHRPEMPPLYERFGVRGVVVSAVDLIKGLGRCAGLDSVEVPGATGDLETNYQGKAYAALRALREYDFAFLHVEAPDEASHRGNLQEKIDAIERFDEQVLGVLKKGLSRLKMPYRLLVLPDHLTPLRIRTHSDTPVPFLLYPEGPDPCTSYSEREAEKSKIHLEEGSKILNLLFEKE